MARINRAAARQRKQRLVKKGGRLVKHARWSEAVWCILAGSAKARMEIANHSGVVFVHFAEVQHTRQRARRMGLCSLAGVSASILLLAAAGCSPTGRGPREGKIIHIASEPLAASWLRQDQALRSAASGLCEKARSVNTWDVAQPLGPTTLPGKGAVYFGKTTWSPAKEWSPRFDLGYSLAESSQDVRILVCIEASRSGSVDYRDSRGRVAPDVKGYRIHWDARILRWPDGRMLAANSFEGEGPPLFAVPNLQREPTGEAPSQEFERWLSGVLKDSETALAVEGSVFDLAWSPNGKSLAIAGPNGALTLWEVSGQASVRRLTGHEGNVLSVTFSPDGKRVASGGQDKQVRLWETTTAKEIRRFGGHSEQVIGVAFSPDGRTLASADVGGGGILWDAEDGRLLSRIGGRFLDHPVVDLSFLPPGKGMVTRDCNGFDVRNAETGRILLKFPGDPGRCLLDVGATADGRTAASVDDSGRIRVWDLEMAAVRSTVIIDPDVSPSPTVQMLALAPDGRTLAIGRSDGSVLVWSAALEKTVAVVAATAQSGGALRSWPCSWGKADLSSNNADAAAVGGLAFSPDGRALAVGSRTGRVRVVPLP